MEYKELLSFILWCYRKKRWCWKVWRSFPHRFASSSQKGLLSCVKSSEQNRLNVFMYIYAYKCTAIYNINVLSWSCQGRGRLEGTQNSLSLQNSKYLLCLRWNYKSAELQLKLTWHWDTSQVGNRQWLKKHSIQNNNWLMLMLILSW